MWHGAIIYQPDMFGFFFFPLFQPPLEFKFCEFEQIWAKQLEHAGRCPHPSLGWTAPIAGVKTRPGSVWDRITRTTSGGGLGRLWPHY